MGFRITPQYAKIEVETFRSLESNIEIIQRVISLFKDTEDFEIATRGLAAGVEAITYSNRADEYGRTSPITRLASMPAWEGSHRDRKREQDLVYSLAAIVGAFAEIEGLDIDELVQPAIAEAQERK